MKKILIYIFALQGFCCASSLKQIMDIGLRTYIYGYPLVLMEVTKRLMTNSISTGTEGHAPMNQFMHAKRMPTYRFTDIVRPNVDTAYSMAWIDVSKEPLVLSVPDTHDRFYVMPFYDMYTRVFNMVGSPTTGTRAGNFLIKSATWKDNVPEDMLQIIVPTDTVWLIGRIQVNGRNDFKRVRALQKQCSLTPLSAWGSAYSPSARLRVDSRLPNKKPMDVVADMKPGLFFTMLMRLMAKYAPEQKDSLLLKDMASIGLVPDLNFRFSQLDAFVQNGLRLVPLRGQVMIGQSAEKAGKVENGWRVLETDIHKVDYLQRAIIAMLGIGALPPEVALYPTTSKDSEGRQLSGDCAYCIHFAKGKLPPVNAFWSLTMYDKDGFLIKNDLGRYALRDRDPLVYNKNGSLDLFVQHSPPSASQESNWLPAPEGDFELTLRMYMPKKSALKGKWKAPNIRRYTCSAQ